MMYTYEMIVEKLKMYPMLQEKLSLLRFELSNVTHISENDVLDSLAYRSSTREVIAGKNSDNRDRMMKMALSYTDLSIQMNTETIEEICQELDEVKSQVDRMDYYMSLLTPEQKQVLQLCFFQRKTWSDIEEESGYSRRTLTKRRNEAIRRLVQMYNYMGAFFDK